MDEVKRDPTSFVQSNRGGSSLLRSLIVADIIDIVDVNDKGRYQNCMFHHYKNHETVDDVHIFDVINKNLWNSFDDVELLLGYKLVIRKWSIQR